MTLKSIYVFWEKFGGVKCCPLIYPANAHGRFDGNLLFGKNVFKRLISTENFCLG